MATLWIGAVMNCVTPKLSEYGGGSPKLHGDGVPSVIMSAQQDASS